MLTHFFFFCFSCDSHSSDVQVYDILRVADVKWSFTSDGATNAWGYKVSVISCSTCPPGLAKIGGGSIVSVAQNCRLCTSGKYAPLGTVGSCLSCPNGKVSSSDFITCDTCPIGRSAIRGKCENCPAGRTTAKNTSFGPLESICQNCKPGYYNNKTTGVCQKPLFSSFHICFFTSQKNYVFLIPSFFFSLFCFQKKGAACAACPAGSSLPTEGATTVESCINCPAGKFAPSIDAPNCENCKIGQFKNEEMLNCEDCKFGTHGNDTLGSTKCVPCGAQKSTARVGTKNVSSCYKCPSSEYNDQNDGGVCLPLAEHTCPIGRAGNRDCPCVEKYADIWSTLRLTHCSGMQLKDDKSGKKLYFDTLNDAKMACAAEPKCRSVYSAGQCAVDEPDKLLPRKFSLCDIQFETYKKSSSSW